MDDYNDKTMTKIRECRHTTNLNSHPQHHTTPLHFITININNPQLQAFPFFFGLIWLIFSLSYLVPQAPTSLLFLLATIISIDSSTKSQIISI